MCDVSRQRWGTFSVRDHVGPQPFAADVLMYERLILPYPADAEERSNWAKSGWEPDRLDAILDLLRTGGAEDKMQSRFPGITTPKLFSKSV